MNNVLTMAISHIGAQSDGTQGATQQGNSTGNPISTDESTSPQIAELV
jgi:hypothetical protein